MAITLLDYISQISAGGPGSGRHKVDGLTWNDQDWPNRSKGIYELKIVNIDELRPWQKYRSRKIVGEYLGKMQRGEELDAFMVRPGRDRFKDVYYLADGHHRYWAAKKLGIKKLAVLVEH